MIAVSFVELKSKTIFSARGLKKRAAGVESRAWSGCLQIYFWPLMTYSRAHSPTTHRVLLRRGTSFCKSKRYSVEILQNWTKPACRSIDNEGGFSNVLEMEGTGSKPIVGKKSVGLTAVSMITKPFEGCPNKITLCVSRKANQFSMRRKQA